MNIKKIISNCIFLFLILLLSSCAKYVDIKDGSDKILLVKKEPTGCISRGTVDVVVLAEIAYVERSEESINIDLLQLAKNSAVSVRANTIVKSASPKPGEATFSMFKCNRPWTK